MKKLLLTGIAALLLATGTAHAQRCPAGEDQFHNCLSTNPTMRARQEQWASGSLARSGRRASPIPTTATAKTYQGVVYSMQTRSGPVTFVHHRDGKSTTFTTADGRHGTLVTHHCGNDFCTYLNGRLIRRAPR